MQLDSTSIITPPCDLFISTLNDINSQYGIHFHEPSSLPSVNSTTQSSPITFTPPSPSLAQPTQTDHPPSSSRHPMDTCAKNDIFKLKHNVDYASLQFYAFHAALFTKTEPHGFKKSSKNPKWMATMHEEMDVFQCNNTRILVPHPSNSNVIGSKWVFHRKYKFDRYIYNFKAHLVA